MTHRVVCVLVRPWDGRSACPPGIDAEEFRVALVEDLLDAVASLQVAVPALAVCPPDQPDVADLVGPGVPLHAIDADPVDAVRVLLTRLAADGADEATVVAADVPDLPGLLVGKLHRALGSAEVAVLPADGGGLVALATRLPLPSWLPTNELTLDDGDTLEKLARSAPRRRDLAVVPGWHRLREPGDIAKLDPGQEGWPATRLLLGG